MDRAIKNLTAFGIGVLFVSMIAFSVNASAAATSVLVGDFTESGWVNSVYSGHNTGENTVSIRTFSIPDDLRPSVGGAVRIGGVNYPVVVAYSNQTEIAVPEDNDVSVVNSLRTAISSGQAISIYLSSVDIDENPDDPNLEFQPDNNDFYLLVTGAFCCLAFAFGFNGGQQR
tara:strand:- start:24 stop:539 length:516 start_codon:yes stop_codon:yes gene_type:complete